MQKNPTAGGGGNKGAPKKGAKVTKKVWMSLLASSRELAILRQRMED
jgi:hypothetical protein